MAQLLELKQQRAFAMNKAEGIIQAAENAGRELTKTEDSEITLCMASVKALDPQIGSIEAKNTLVKRMTGGMILPGSGLATLDGRPFSKEAGPTFYSQDYAQDFHEYVASGGKKIGATLYEGSNSAGGFAVPSMVNDQIVPLAPQEMAIRRLATVLPTVMDMKVPRKGAFGVASAKAEQAAFTESDPTLEQFTLSAYMAGIQETISWELAQDVPAFQAFAVTDMILALQMFEEAWYTTGTGVNQAQGLIGNVGAGVTEEPDTAGNLISIDGTLDLTGTLNAAYHANASWLMSRSTSIIIRKAQRQANLFEPVWTRVGTQNYLHGYPVEFSAYMPNAARGATPLLFGDFKQGYIIGDRGGSGISVKILDQPLATQGKIILLAYRRTDGRVRRSEAIQQYNIAAS